MEEKVLIPARMLNEHAYCPRLFALEWINGDWAESSDTVRGQTAHRRVDETTQKGLQTPANAGDPHSVRSVELGDTELGLISKIDLVEQERGEVCPIDYKKGRPPENPQQSWEPERVQLCVQGLLLRKHGYCCDRGVLYFTEAKRRIEVPFDEDLVGITLAQRDAAERILRSGQLPPPLVDSPKCPRCSLVGICLPDEQNVLNGNGDSVRPMIPDRDDGVPLYLELQGGKLSKDHHEIVVREKGSIVERVRITSTSRVIVSGSASITTPLLQELAGRRIPVSFHSWGGWLYGVYISTSGHNVLGRISQHQAAANPVKSLDIARQMVNAKIRNSRVLLRRNSRNGSDEVLLALRQLANKALSVSSHQALMGIEGMAAKNYFQQFQSMFKGDADTGFDFRLRNRRPPRDPVNSLLSFAYACLVREVTNIIHGVGLDPYVGFLHQPRPGRPALALDLMEEFRPVISDSVVLSVINNSIVAASDFHIRPTGVALHRAGRQRFIRAFERRMNDTVIHPLFGTSLSYRRILEVQARMLGKTVLGEVDEYPAFLIR